jgi:hypothetical protein
MASEEEVKAYQVRNSFYVCPVCASDEEKVADDTVKVTAEDVVHDSTSPLECMRCKKMIE